MEEQNSNLKASLSEMHDKLRDANILHRDEIDRLRESVMEHKNKLHKEFKLRLQVILYTHTYTQTHTHTHTKTHKHINEQTNKQRKNL